MDEYEDAFSPEEGGGDKHQNKKAFDEDIITFVDQNASAVATIDQSGGYNGTVDGGTW